MRQPTVLERPMAWYLATLFALLLTLPGWPLPSWPVAPAQTSLTQAARLERIERQQWQQASAMGQAQLTVSLPRS
ncbi:hypothetical protein [Aeromonas bivalvium]|uniref:hypothetical protein n=1 Tax=Aeromonas bivalvium TaxID=440079 RepID=UPI0038CFFEA8